MADEEGLQEVAESTGGGGGGGFPTWAIWLIVAAVVIIAIVAVVVVLFVVDSGPPNQAPTISSLVPASTSVAPGGNTMITCTATDPDGDPLTYYWSASGGDVTGSGSSATWTAPAAPGTYSVQVTAEDGRGGSATRDISFTTQAAPVNSPPSITSVTPGSATVPPGGSTSVTCTATDPDGDPLTYGWQASLGTISGTGSSITWQAPMTQGIYSIQCDVEDGRGGNAHKSTNVEVAVVVTTGSINIQSTPAGAKIFLDGVDTGSITPYIITGVSDGVHILKLTYLHYKDRQEPVPVTAGDTTYRNWALTYAPTQTIVIQPDGAAGKDAWVYENQPTTNKGGDTDLVVGGCIAIADDRSYLQFDLTGIPSSIVVESVSLSLWYHGDALPSSSGPVGAYRVTDSWDEGTITWNNQPTFDATPEHTQNLPGTATNGFRTWYITDLVRGWIDSSIANYGVLLMDTDESTHECYKFFYSSDHGTAAERPKLTIQYYDPVP